MSEIGFGLGIIAIYVLGVVYVLNNMHALPGMIANFHQAIGY